MKRFISVLLILALIGSAVPSFAETWRCPGCSQENTGNFCGQCGAKKPAQTPLDEQAGFSSLDAYFRNALSITVLGTITTAVNGEQKVIGYYYEGMLPAADQTIAAEFQLHGHSLLFKFRKDGAVSEKDQEKARAWAEKNSGSLSDSVFDAGKAYFNGAAFYYELTKELSDDWQNEIAEAQPAGFGLMAQRLDELTVLSAENRATSAPAPTQKPTSKPTQKPTSKPTSKPAAKPAYDIPDLTAFFLFRPLCLGQMAQHGADQYNSNYMYYTYDYYNGFIEDSNLKLYRSIIESQYEFKLVEHIDKTVMASRTITYYYRYTGAKRVTDVKTSVDPKSVGQYNLSITISNSGESDHSGISVRFSPELTYAGSGQKQGQWFKDESSSQTAAPNPVKPDPNPIPTPKPAPKPTVKCVKCHGQGTISCPQCDGKGYRIEYTNSAIGGKRGETKVTCSKCHRAGSITCPRCHGSKVEP